MWGFSEKKTNDNKDDVKVIQKKFLASMSYDIRDPLNSICGISEIAVKNLENNGDREMLKNYLEIIRDSAYELQEVVNNRFAQFEREEGREAFAEGDDSNENSKVTDDNCKILNNLRVLVIEDSEVSRLIAQEILSEHGALVTLCSSGEEGVQKFTSSITGTYDVIFMDIKMPGIDGYEATERIRKSNHPQAKHIPIIAMTAEAFAEDVENAMKAGMNGHVSKPIHLDKMIIAIRNSIT